MPKVERSKRGIPEGLWLRCPQCKATIFRKEVEARLNVCPDCDHHFYVSARDRLMQLLDENSFEEMDADLRPVDTLGFVDSQPYAKRIVEQQKKTGMGDAAVSGTGFIRGRGVVIGITDFAFMAGSMGGGRRRETGTGCGKSDRTQTATHFRIGFRWRCADARRDSVADANGQSIGGARSIPFGRWTLYLHSNQSDDGWCRRELGVPR